MPFDPNTAKPIQAPQFDPNTARVATSWLDELENLPGFLKESAGKAAASGIRTWDAATDKLGQLPNGIGLINTAIKAMTGGKKAAVDTANAVDTPDEPTADPAVRAFNSGIRGIGGAAALPVPGAGVVPNLATGAAGGMAASPMGDAAANVSPKLRPYGELLGQLFGGGAAGFFTGPKQSLGKQDLRRAMGSTTEKDFADARAMSDKATSVGAKTATGAEMFAPDSPIMALASKTRDTNINNDLRTRTQGREADLQDLAGTYKSRIGPDVDPNQVANSAADSAGGVIETLKGTRGGEIASNLAAIKPIAPHDIAAIEQYLIAQATTPGISHGRAAAFREAASKLRDSQGNILTDPQALSLRLVEMQNAPNNPNFTGFNGQAVDKVDVANALTAARQSIGFFRPDFTQALENFGKASERIRDVKAGPIGSVADRNPLTAGQTPVSRLDSMVTGNHPNTVKSTAQTLQSSSATGGNPTKATDIARALAEQKLRLGPTDPGQAIRGNAGSRANDQMDALLEAGGLNPKTVNAPLEIADQLQSFAKPAGVNELPRMQPWQMAIRPFRTLDMMATGQMERGVNQEVAKLLADPSPEALRELQKISMFNPNVRRMLMLRDAVTGPEEK